MSTVEMKPWEVHIMQLQPAIDWSLVWDNLHNVILPNGARSAWYMVIHITPTNVRLHKSKWWDTEKCTQSGRQGTIPYRLTECRVRQEIWEWTRTRIPWIQGSEPRSIRKEWLLRPFQILATTKTTGDLVVFGEYVFFMWWINAKPYQEWTTLASRFRCGGRYIRTKIGCNSWETIWKWSKQAWNTVTLYKWDEQQAREVVTCTYYTRLQN